MAGKDKPSTDHTRQHRCAPYKTTRRARRARRSPPPEPVSPPAPRARTGSAGWCSREGCYESGSHMHDEKTDLNSNTNVQDGQVTRSVLAALSDFIENGSTKCDANLDPQLSGQTREVIDGQTRIPEDANAVLDAPVPTLSHNGAENFTGNSSDQVLRLPPGDGAPPDTQTLSGSPLQFHEGSGGPPPTFLISSYCTSTNCPIRYGHYRGVYLYDYYQSPYLDDVFGASSPPPFIREARARQLIGQASHEDVELVRRFRQYHGIAERCNSPACPIKTAHVSGLYVHDSRWAMCVTDEFGISNPPPEIWDCWGRKLIGNASKEDKEMIEQFVIHHGKE